MRRFRNNNSNKIVEETKSITSSFHEMAEGFLDSHIVITEDMILNDLARDFNDISELLNSYIREISHVLSHFSAGDMTVESDKEVKYKGDFVPINNALTKLSHSLNNTFASISELSNCIDDMCSELDISSNTIAQNATEQVTLISDLSSTMQDITKKTSQNTEYAKLASENAVITKKEAEDGRLLMNQMLTSMDEVKSSTNEISNVIEMIKNIATQTKLLSLNASIEAARAGENGRGFAVVAEEVGVLASQSALAVNQTTELIQNNIQKVNESTEIANKTAESFSIIQNSIDKIADLNVQIVESAKVQETSFQETNNIIANISSVVESNAAFAEEGAASISNMLEQSNKLKDLISKFRIKGQNNSIYRDVKADSNYDKALMNDLINSLMSCNSMNSMDDTLESIIKERPEIECFYVIDKNGVQISHTVMNPTVMIEKDQNFEPNQPGTNNSSKKYYRQAVLLNGDVYCTPDYISGATGKLCRTISKLYKSSNTNEYVICADISCFIE